MSSTPHITTRRGFIAALGFGGVSLYGLWAAYGAAPGPLTLLGLGGHDAETAGGHGSGHGGHGAAPHGPTAEDFHRMTAEFIERYRLPDGTVYPRRLAMHDSSAGGDGAHDIGHGAMDHGAMDHGAMDHGAMDHGAMDHGAMDHGAMDHGAMDHGAMDHGAMDHGAMDHGAMDHGAMDHGAMADGHAAARESGHGAATQGDHGADDDHAHEDGAIDVYLAAGMWYYRPAKLQLDAGQRYRFRMMAVDVSHGASIQFGRGGRMVRLRPGRVTEMDVSFHAPGRYLVYCTVYCGPAHDVMQATIEVV